MYLANRQTLHADTQTQQETPIRATQGYVDANRQRGHRVAGRLGVDRPLIIYSVAVRATRFYAAK